MAENINIDKDLQEGLRLLDEGTSIDKAFKLINKSARRGKSKGKSFFVIGRIIREGNKAANMSGDHEEARRYYDTAIKEFTKHDEETLDSLDFRDMGDYYYYYLGTEARDLNKALYYYKKSADLGDEESAKKVSTIEAELASGNENQAPTLSENTKVETEKPEPSDLEDVTPKELLRPEGRIYETKDEEIKKVISSDEVLLRAIRLLTSNAATESEREEGLEMIKMASEEGSVRALVLLGYLYEGDNSLVAADFEKAKEYYEKAIALSSSVAMYRLGLLYGNEELSFYDEKQGHDLIIQSARLGYPYALNRLGDAYRAKVYDTKNLDLAYQYYALAGEKGLGLAYHNMAEIDASRQQIDLSRQHEKSAEENGYVLASGEQEPAFTAIK